MSVQTFYLSWQTSKHELEIQFVLPQMGMELLRIMEQRQCKVLLAWDGNLEDHLLCIDSLENLAITKARFVDKINWLSQSMSISGIFFLEKEKNAIVYRVGKFIINLASTTAHLKSI